MGDHDLLCEMMTFWGITNYDYTCISSVVGCLKIQNSASKQVLNHIKNGFADSDR